MYVQIYCIVYLLFEKFCQWVLPNYCNIQILYIYIYIYIFFPPVFISIDQFFSYLFYYSVRDSLKGGRIDGCKGGWIEEGVEGWKIGKRRKKGKGMKG